MAKNSMEKQGPYFMVALLFLVYNRMGKTRDLFKKIVDIKGKFHAKLGMIKYRNSKDLTEEEI